MYAVRLKAGSVGTGTVTYQIDFVISGVDTRYTFADITDKFIRKATAKITKFVYGDFFVSLSAD